MGVGVYLNFKGNAKEALAFYEQALEGKSKGVMTYAEMPADENYPLDDETKALIMNAELEVDGSIIMVSDITKDMESEFVQGNQMTAIIDIDSVDKVKRYYDKLSVGGIVVIALEATFWSPAYAYVIDKFGVGWQLNCTLKP